MHRNAPYLRRCLTIKAAMPTPTILAAVIASVLMLLTSSAKAFLPITLA